MARSSRRRVESTRHSVWPTGLVRLLRSARLWKRTPPRIRTGVVAAASPGGGSAGQQEGRDGEATPSRDHQRGPESGPLPAPPAAVGGDPPRTPDAHSWSQLEFSVRSACGQRAVGVRSACAQRTPTYLLNSRRFP